MESVNEKLMTAARWDNEAHLKALLLHPECDPMSKDPRGMTALMWAAHHGSLSCAQLLLPVSDARSQDDSGMTALMYAALAGRFDCIKPLLPVSDVLMKAQGGKSAGDRARDLARDGGRGGVESAALIDAYVFSMNEATALNASIGPGVTRKSAPLRV